MLKFNVQLYFDYLIQYTFKNCLTSEKITAVELKENISKTLFYSSPGGGDIWTQIFPHGQAFDQQSCPGRGERGGGGGQMWDLKNFEQGGIN